MYCIKHITGEKYIKISFHTKFCIGQNSYFIYEMNIIMTVNKLRSYLSNVCMNLKLINEVEFLKQKNILNDD